MKISHYDDTMTQAVQQYQKTDQVSSETAKKVKADVAPQEQVDLSTQAKEFRQIKGLVTNQPEVREDKVEELKSRISAGTYQADAGKIADRMVGESLLDIFA
ncbi:MAG: flagellar biosynthesis anti-sigma factor FlgM [Smithellaceae bacterium]|nr:flagellar biosynthesis anti-sigma factor FlgM [Smithellaceae bacterium]